MGQFHFHPDSYLELMLSEMPGYHRLQEAAAAATGSGAARVLGPRLAWSEGDLAVLVADGRS